MKVAEARAALLKSVDNFGDLMCRCQLDGVKPALMDIDDKITVLIESAKTEQAAAMLTTVRERAGRA